jgi:hypothetical protein
MNHIKWIIDHTQRSWSLGHREGDEPVRDTHPKMTPGLAGKRTSRFEIRRLLLGQK